MKIGRDYQLIVTIIKKGFAERVVNADAIEMILEEK